MSSEPSTPPPSTDDFKEKADKLVGFFQWLAALVAARNWLALLLVVDLGAIFALHPKSGFVLRFLTDTLSLKLPNWYSSVFWFVVGSVSVAALVVAVKTAPRPKNLDVADAGTRRAIKGLRAFGVEDAEIFAKLQRNQSLQDCLESLSEKEFRIGFLVAESGCGKTSFLQAGLLPKLLQPDASLRGVYVKFSDRPPLNTIRTELVEQLQLPKDKAEQVDFLGLLQMAVDAAQKPVVLMLDQFEQFFVHQPHKDDRQPFLQALTDWYCSAEPPIKILVSVRADIYHELCAIQQALKYTPSRYGVFKLEKFEPEEAAEILQVLAETEQLRFDKRFAEELTREELTSAEGKVSPVNLQIFAEVVRKQKSAEQRAFNREAFQKLGGIDGLLNRYLEETLEALRLQGHADLYQAALQVLLALIDRELNVRTGVLTEDDLQDKVKGLVKPTDVITATRWLASSEVRLITPVEQNNTTGYELAHERIISALLRLAGKELKDADRANQLLERRVNEWLGNQRNPRYLLPWRELRLIERYKTQLVWGAKQRAKEQLLKQSWRRWQQVGWAVMASCILLLAGWLWWLSPPAQRWQMQRELARISQRTPYELRPEIATAFAKQGNQQRAFQIANSMTQDSLQTSKAFNQILEVAGQLNDIQTINVLSQSIYATTKKARGYISPAAINVLRAIAKAYGEVKDTQQAKAGLDRLLATTETLKYELPVKVNLLVAIAEAYSKANDPPKAIAVLEQAHIITESFKVTRSVKDDELSRLYQVNNLINIAEAYGKAGDSHSANAVLEQARVIAETVRGKSWLYKDETLRAIAKVYGQLNDFQRAKAGLDKIYLSAKTLTDSSPSKLKVLSAIAESYNKLNDPQRAKVVLDQALGITKAFEDDIPRKSSFLVEIAKGYGQLNDSQLVKAGLDHIRSAAETLTGYPPFKANLLVTLANLYGQLNDSRLAKTGLGQIRLAAETLTNDPPSKIDVLIAIAESYGKLNASPSAKAILEEVSTIIESIKDNSSFYPDGTELSKAIAMAETYIKLNEPQNAQIILERALANQYIFYNPSVLIKVQCEISEAFHTKNQADKSRIILIQAHEVAKTIQDQPARILALSMIAELQAKLGDWRGAHLISKDCNSDECTVQVLTKVVTYWAEQKHPELIQKEKKEVEELIPDELIF